MSVAPWEVRKDLASGVQHRGGGSEGRGQAASGAEEARSWQDVEAVVRRLDSGKESGQRDEITYLMG